MYPLGVDPGHHLRSEDGVPAANEEVVRDADGGNAQDLREERCELRLDGARRGPGRSRLTAHGPRHAGEPQLAGKLEPLNLARGSLWDLVDEDEPTGDLEIREPNSDKLLELLLGGDCAVAQHDGCGDLLSEHRIGDREGHGLRDGRVVEQHLVDLSRRDLLTAAIDDLLDAPAEKQIAVIVDEALVPRSEPPMDECALVCSVVRLVAVEDVLPTHRNLTDRSSAEKAPLVVENTYYGSCCTPDRAGLAATGTRRVACHLVRCLRHPVCLDHRYSEDRLELLEHPWWKRGRGGTYEAEAGLLDGLLVRPRSREDALVHCRNCRVPGWARLAKPRIEALGMKSRRADKAAPRPHRGERGSNETVDMEQRHHVQTAVGRSQLECGGHVLRGGTQISVRQGHQLRARGRSGRVKHQCRSGTAIAGRTVQTARSTGDFELEQAGFGMVQWLEFDDLDSQRARDVSNGRRR